MNEDLNNRLTELLDELLELRQKGVGGALVDDVIYKGQQFFIRIDTAEEDDE